MKPVYWEGSEPRECDGCGNPIKGRFSDMKTRTGPWGKLCPTCADEGPGIGCFGEGLGQEYTQLPDGRWLKTRG